MRGQGRTAHDWGEPRPRIAARLGGTIRRWLGGRRPQAPSVLRALPVALRHEELAADYLGAESADDHQRAGAASSAAMERAISAADWWRADVWAHRALWHFEKAELTLQAVRMSRRIGDLRSAAGDPGSARRYYAEAIDEARDVGAEREQGLAALGLGQALLQLGEVTSARRLGRAAKDLLGRSGATAGEVADAAALQGMEKPVGHAGGGEEDE